MKALILTAKGDPLQYGDFEDPVAAAGEVVVELRAAALNHRDVFITQGLYPGIRYPVILGSDGAGLLDGHEVVINPANDWGDDPRTQSKAFHILGLPRNGTLAERIAIPAQKVCPKPAHLSMEEAAALPLGGMTIYRALFTRGQLRAGERILISGIGGGVALLGLQFARAAGAEIWVSSGSEEKIERARALGARGGANYRHEGWAEQLLQQSGGFDLILDSAGGDGFSQFLKLARPGARIVSYGGSLGSISKLSPQILFWKQLSILGSTMATDEEFVMMLRFVEQHRIRPVIDKVFDLSNGQAAFDRMERGEQFGKIVLKTA